MFKFSKLIITLFGIGFFPIASGTIGSLATFILFYHIISYVSILALVLLFIIIFILSLILINIYSSHIKIYDSSEIVIDEFLGILLILIFYESIKFTNDILMFFIIFFLFRFFDIVKIFPANWIDKNVKNSFGVILDDLVAGMYCIVVLFILNVFI